MWETEVVKWAAGGGAGGVTLGLAIIAYKFYEARVKGKKTLALTEMEIESGTNKEWKTFAQFMQGQVKTLAERLTQEEEQTRLMRTKYDKELKDVREEEQSCRRLYGALRIWCDRCEAAMRAAEIPFKPFDSKDFGEERK